MSLYTEVRFGPEWHRAIAALGIAEHQLPREVQAVLRDTAFRAANKAAAKALTIPARKEKHRGTRRTVSKGVGVRRTNVGYRVVTSMPSGMEALPRGFHSQWGHPVFGSGWTIQHSHYNWFMEPIASEYEETYAALLRQLLQSARFVDRMTSGR